MKLPAPTPLTAELQEIGRQRGDTPRIVRQVINSIRSPLREAPVGTDLFSDLLRYEFGLPFDKIHGNRVFGTHQHNEIWQLYSAVRTALRYLKRNDLDHFLRRIADQNKHGDALIEMRPVSKLPRFANARYEIPGRDGKRIDWEVGLGPLTVRFDVKNRVRGAIEHFKDIAIEMSKGNRNPPIPGTDPEAFFRDTQEKFRHNRNPLILQGVWAQVYIKENRALLEGYFRNVLDPRKIDFLVVCDWGQDAYLLSRRKWQHVFLRRLFALRDSENFVF